MTTGIRPIVLYREMCSSVMLVMKPRQLFCLWYKIQRNENLIRTTMFLCQIFKSFVSIHPEAEHEFSWQWHTSSLVALFKLQKVNVPRVQVLTSQVLINFSQSLAATWGAPRRCWVRANPHRRTTSICCAGTSSMPQFGIWRETLLRKGPRFAPRP